MRSFVAEFYDQIVEVFARHGVAVPFTLERVRILYRYLHDSGNLLPIAVMGPDQRTCMATGIFLMNDKELYLWNWTHRYEFRWYCPTELLTWTAMKTALENGCTTFDMGGGGEAKVKFGAVPDDSVQRWMWARYQWIFTLRDMARKVLKWRQRVKGRFVRDRLLAHCSKFSSPLRESGAPVKSMETSRD